MPCGSIFRWQERSKPSPTLSIVPLFMGSRTTPPRSSTSRPCIASRVPPCSVLGEETSNGRRWNRRLLLVPQDRAAQIDAMVEASQQGMIVDLEPMAIVLPAGKMLHRPSSAGRRRRSEISRGTPREGPVRPVRCLGGTACRRVHCSQARRRSRGGGDRGGRFRGPTSVGRAGPSNPCPHSLWPRASRLANCRAVDDGRWRRSPAADRQQSGGGSRGAGFGGGDFEVDFPYGSDGEWEQAIDELVAGGMNVMADLGMWSNWKMPVSYRAMPELRSTAADAYDEVSGASLADFERIAGTG